MHTDSACGEIKALLGCKSLIGQSRFIGKVYQKVNCVLLQMYLLDYFLTGHAYIRIVFVYECIYSSQCIPQDSSAQCIVGSPPYLLHPQIIGAEDDYFDSQQEQVSKELFQSNSLENKLIGCHIIFICMNISTFILYSVPLNK